MREGAAKDSGRRVAGRKVVTSSATAMTSLSIIICTWNRSESLRSTLASLQLQRSAGFAFIEVIVVDNNSSDNTAACVEALIPTWRLGTLRYCFEGRQGKQFALNTGIAQSRAQLLAFTDDDILFPDDWVSALFGAFESSPLEVAGGKTILTWPEGGKPRWYAPAMAAVLGGVDLGEQPLLPPPPGYAPAGANLVARRELFDRIGFFSESHFRHMDYEFGMRCVRERAVLGYIPSVVVAAPVDPAMLSKRYFRRWAFKAGIAHEGADATDAPTLLRVPRWVYRQLLKDIVVWPVEWLLASQAVAFTRELRIWRMVAAVCSAWYVWIWPEQYPQWVARYSQKKNNLY